jgi:hypothetical protein
MGSRGWWVIRIESEAAAKAAQAVTILRIADGINRAHTIEEKTAKYRAGM